MANCLGRRLQIRILKLTARSILGQSKSVEDTDKQLHKILPVKDGGHKAYRVAYAVHVASRSESNTAIGGPQPNNPVPSNPTLVGLVTLIEVDAKLLSLPDELTLPASAEPNTLMMHLGYHFLPRAWYKGYAAEAVSAVLETCARRPSFWSPYDRVYVQGIVDDENPASSRVMAKMGIPERGPHTWRGDKVWLGGQWREQCNIHVFGKYII